MYVVLALDCYDRHKPKNLMESFVDASSDEFKAVSPPNEAADALPAGEADEFNMHEMWKLLATSQENVPTKQKRGQGKFNADKKFEQEKRSRQKVEKWEAGVTAARKQISSHCGCEYTDMEMGTLHMAWHDKSQMHQRTWLFERTSEYWAARQKNDPNNNETRWEAPNYGHHATLCSACWRQAHGNIGKTRFQTILKLVKQGGRRLPPKTYRDRASQHKTRSAIAWVRWLG